MTRGEKKSGESIGGIYVTKRVATAAKDNDSFVTNPLSVSQK